MIYHVGHSVQMNILILECTNNKYGDGCQTNCGHCLNMSQCHHINGTCFDGCDPGYEGQKCNQGT